MFSGPLSCFVMDHKNEACPDNHWYLICYSIIGLKTTPQWWVIVLLNGEALYYNTG